MNEILAIFLNMPRGERERLIKLAKGIARVTRMPLNDAAEMLLTMRRQNQDTYHGADGSYIRAKI